MAKVAFVSEDRALKGRLCCDECATCLCCTGLGENDKGRPIGAWLTVESEDEGYETVCPNCVPKLLKAKNKKIKNLQSTVAKIEAAHRKQTVKKIMSIPKKR